VKLAMVISQTNPELVFNAFRLANFSRKEGDEVKDLHALAREADRVVMF
jgi:hypothetical protein